MTVLQTAKIEGRFSGPTVFIMKHKFFFISFLILISACAKVENGTNLEYEIKRIEIPISSEQLNSYQEFSVYNTGSNRMVA